MEYNFKLSEIIAGCESGAWLEGAVFENENHEFLYFGRDKFYGMKFLKTQNNWRFAYYQEEEDFLK